MSAPIPSVPSATRSPSAPTRRAADRVVHVGARRCGRRWRLTSRTSAISRRRGGRSGRAASARRARPRAASRVDNAARRTGRSQSRSSAASSATWMCRPVPTSSASSAQRGKRLVREGERGVRAHQPAREREPSGQPRLEEPPVLLDPGRRALGAVAVGRLVAEHRADAERARARSAIRSSEPSIAFGDAWWSTRVVVPASSASSPPTSAEAPMLSSSSARSSRHQTRCRIWTKFVRRLQRVRHAACQRRVEVRVRADVARDDHAARAVSRRPSGDPADAGDPAVLDPQVADRDARRIERLDDRRTREDHATTAFARGRVCGRGAALRRAPPGSPSSAARCAGCRRSDRARRPPPARSGTRPISPTPLAPNGPSGSAPRRGCTRRRGIACARKTMFRALQGLGHRTPPSTTSSSESAKPRPMWIEPSSWPSSEHGVDDAGRRRARRPPSRACPRRRGSRAASRSRTTGA